MNSNPAIAVLLGAGASADAGIPTTKGMTQAVIDRIQLPEHRRALEFIRHTLAASAASRGSNDPEVDVERLFAAVELLIHRYEQPWSPFVGSWSAGLESFSSGSAMSEHSLESMLRPLDRDPNRFASTSLSRVVAKAITKAISSARPHDVSDLLRRARAEMLGSLRDVLRIANVSQVGYLSPLLGLAEDQDSLTVATLNYDRSVEEIAEQEGIDCDTGIETWLAQDAFAWKEKGLRLLKLHGSIDWAIGESWEPAKLPLRKITKLDPTVTGRHAEPAVVFGEGGKLRSEGPFLELLLAWSAHLNRASTLLVVGYSFRDQHVNEIIGRWFNAAPTRKVILVDPENPRTQDSPPFLFQLAGFAEPNLNASQPYVRFQHFAGPASQVLATAIRTSSQRLEAQEVSG